MYEQGNSKCFKMKRMTESVKHCDKRKWKKNTFKQIKARNSLHKRRKDWDFTQRPMGKRCTVFYLLTAKELSAASTCSVWTLAWTSWPEALDQKKAAGHKQNKRMMFKPSPPFSPREWAGKANVVNWLDQTQNPELETKPNHLRILAEFHHGLSRFW